MNDYTFTQKDSQIVTGLESNFGSLPVDASHVAFAGAIGAGPQTVDVSDTPVVSPATVSNSAVTTLHIPLNAVSVTFLAVTNTVNISESDATVSGHYFTIPTGVQVVVDVSRTGILYLEANTGSATVSFYFNVV